MRHRATTRYKHGGKHRGKVISRAEQARRIAQSFGHSNMWAMNKDDYERISQTQQTNSNTLFTDEVVDTGTIKIS